MDVLNSKLDSVMHSQGKNQTLQAVQSKAEKNVLIEKSIFVEMTDEQGTPTEQAYQTAVNKMNEFMEHTQRNSKFIFHSDLERYYVELVDAETQKVVKEIPPKELLDAYYEMQKLVGKIFDTQA